MYVKMNYLLLGNLNRNYYFYQPFEEFFQFYNKKFVNEIYPFIFPVRWMLLPAK